MDHPRPSPQTKEKHYHLRLATILSFLLASTLLLPYGIKSGRALPTIGLAPMFLSTATGIAAMGGELRSPKISACIDLFLATFLFAILMPRCARLISCFLPPQLDANELSSLVLAGY